MRMEWGCREMAEPANQDLKEGQTKPLGVTTTLVRRTQVSKGRVGCIAALVKEMTRGSTSMLVRAESGPKSARQVGSFSSCVTAPNHKLNFTPSFLFECPPCSLWHHVHRSAMTTVPTCSPYVTVAQCSQHSKLNERNKTAVAAPKHERKR